MAAEDRQESNTSAKTRSRSLPEAEFFRQYVSPDSFAKDSGIMSDAGSDAVATAENADVIVDPDAIPAAETLTTPVRASAVRDPRLLDLKCATIWAHYYPEGKWGWAVVWCACVVQIVNHGLQMSVGILLLHSLPLFQPRPSEVATGGFFSFSLHESEEPYLPRRQI